MLLIGCDVTRAENHRAEAAELDSVRCALRGMSQGRGCRCQRPFASDDQAPSDPPLQLLLQAQPCSSVTQRWGREVALEDAPVAWCVPSSTWTKILPPSPRFGPDPITLRSSTLLDWPPSMWPHLKARKKAQPASGVPLGKLAHPFLLETKIRHLWRCLEVCSLLSAPPMAAFDWGSVATGGGPGQLHTEPSW